MTSEEKNTMDAALPLILTSEKTNPITGIGILSLSSQNVTNVECKDVKTVLRKASLVIVETGVTFCKSYGGLIMALSASVFFSSSMLIIKTMEVHGLRPFGSALIFNGMIVIPSILCIIVNEYGPGWRNRSRVCQGIWPINTREEWNTILLLCLQSILQAAAVICRTYALQFLSIGDMTVIVFSSPVVTTVIAHFVLKEKCGLVFIGIAIFTLVGVILITKPPIITGEKGFDVQTLTGSGIAAGALLTISLIFVVTRKIKEQHVFAMTLILGSGGVLLSLPPFLIFEDWDSIIPKNTETLLLTLGFLAAFFAIFSIMMALKMENAGLVALVRSCDVIFAFLLQYLFLGVKPDIWSGLGASIVWLGVFFAGCHKYWSDRKDRKARKFHSRNGQDGF